MRPPALPAGGVVAVVRGKKTLLFCITVICPSLVPRGGALFSDRLPYLAQPRGDWVSVLGFHARVVGTRGILRGGYVC